MGFYFLSGLLLYMGFEPAPTLSTAKMPPQSRPFYRYTNTPEYLRFMSASFPISGITIQMHLNIVSRHFLFSALQTFSILFEGEPYLSRFAHLIFRLCYLDFGLLCRPYPSCLQYLMRGRVSPIKVHASDSSAMLLGLRITLQTSSFLPSQGRVSPIKVYASDSTAMLPGPWTTLQISSFLPSVSHAGESFTYQGLRI